MKGGMDERTLGIGSCYTGTTIVDEILNEGWGLPHFTGYVYASLFDVITVLLLPLHRSPSLLIRMGCLRHRGGTSYHYATAGPCLKQIVRRSWSTQRVDRSGIIDLGFLERLLRNWDDEGVSKRR